MTNGTNRLTKAALGVGIFVHVGFEVGVHDAEKKGRFIISSLRGGPQPSGRLFEVLLDAIALPVHLGQQRLCVGVMLADSMARRSSRLPKSRPRGGNHGSHYVNRS